MAKLNFNNDKGNNNLALVNPALAKQWHLTKNGNLTPMDVTAGSSKKVWWICKRGHEWQAIISNRSNGLGCPYCSGKAVCKDNCLQTVKPTLAQEWHPTNNGNLTSADVTVKSAKKVWWICKKNHEWQATISHRSDGQGCPYCSGQAVCTDNCLETVNPTLAKEWHPTKNENLTPKHVSNGSEKKVWWICKRGHEWQARIANRSKGKGCPFCSGRFASKDNCLQMINSALAQEWHPTKNGNLTPRDVTTGSTKKVWWICKRGHEWQATVYGRNNGTRCPYCNSSTSELQLRIYCEMKYIFEQVVHRKKLFGKECDIYIPSLNLGIEVDGSFWHKDKYQDDINKNLYYAQKGVTLFRIRETPLKQISHTDIFTSRRINTFSIVLQLLRQIKNKVIIKLFAPDNAGYTGGHANAGL